MTPRRHRTAGHGDGPKLEEQKALVAGVARRLGSRTRLVCSARELDGLTHLSSKYSAALYADALREHAARRSCLRSVALRAGEMFAAMFKHVYGASCPEDVPRQARLDMQGVVLQIVSRAAQPLHDDWAVDEPVVRYAAAFVAAFGAYDPRESVECPHDALWSLLAACSGGATSSKLGGAGRRLGWYGALVRIALVDTSKAGTWEGMLRATKRHTELHKDIGAQLASGELDDAVRATADAALKGGRTRTRHQPLAATVNIPPDKPLDNAADKRLDNAADKPLDNAVTDPTPAPLDNALSNELDVDIPDAWLSMLDNFEWAPTTTPASPETPIRKLRTTQTGMGTFFRVRTRRNLRSPIDLRGKALSFERGGGNWTMRCAEHAATLELPGDEVAEDCEVLSTAYVSAIHTPPFMPGGVGMWDVSFHEALAGGPIFSPNMFHYMKRN